MKLLKTKEHIEDGIKLYKVTSRGFFGNTYDYKTVYDLDEAVSLSNNGWNFKDMNTFMHNMTLSLWRDLKNHKEETNKH